MKMKVKKDEVNLQDADVGQQVSNNFMILTKNIPLTQRTKRF